MAKVRLYGDTSGYVDLKAPDVAGDVTITLPNDSLNLGAGYRYAGTRYYTSSGNFVKADPLGTGDIGLRAIRVRAVGGGGGGGGVPDTGAGQYAIASGGQGGVYGEVFVDDVTALSSTVAVTVGLGGAGGAAGANDGTAGGTTSFGSVMVLDGGREGLSAGAGSPPRIRTANAPNTGATGADIVFVGRPGFPGWALDGLFIAGSGGYTFLAPESQTTLGGSNTRRGGPPGIAPGGGGSGAGNSGVQTAVGGGAGAAGVVFVDCFV